MTQSERTAGLLDSDLAYALFDLATAIKAQPEYDALLAAYRAFQADAQAQQVQKDLRKRYRKINTEKEWLEYELCLAEFHALPVTAAYFQAENDLRELVKEIDRVIGESAGLAFAAYAKQSCCGG